MNIRDSIPNSFKQQIRPLFVSYRHIGLKPTDIFLASYPKSGNTWLKFMLTSLFINENLGFDEVELLLPYVGNQTNKALLPDGRRVLKTHENYRREYKKAIYILRDGRDVAISYYYFLTRKNAYRGTLEQFVQDFCNGKINGYSPWHKHVMGWSKATNNADILIVKYEECLLNPKNILKEIVGFLEIEVSEELMDLAVLKNSKEKMRSKEKYSIKAMDIYNKDIPFVRSGRSGEWRREFSNELNDFFLDVASDVIDTFEYQRT